MLVEDLFDLGFGDGHCFEVEFEDESGPKSGSEAGVVGVG